MGRQQEGTSIAGLKRKPFSPKATILSSVLPPLSLRNLVIAGFIRALVWHKTTIFSFVFLFYFIPLQAPPPCQDANTVKSFIRI